MFLLFQKRFLLLKRCFHVWHLPQVMNCRGHIGHAHSHISSSSCFTMVRCSLLLCVWWHYKEGVLQCNEMNKPVEKWSGFLRSGVPDFFDRRNIIEYCRTCMENPAESSFQPTSAITESRCVRTLAHSE